MPDTPEEIEGRSSSRPLITIAIPAYNRPALLAEALASVAAQRARISLEVVVCDDLGTEATRRVVEGFPSDTFRYHANPVTLGAVGNWNECLRKARGTWVMVLHEDDTLYPWYLESVLPHLGPDSVAVSTLTTRGREAPGVHEPSGTPAVVDYPPEFFLKSSMTPFPGVLVRRDVALKLGGFDQRWGPVADYDFWYRLSVAGRVRQVRTVGAFYRVGPGQWTERVWGRMLGLTHLLRLRIASELFPSDPRLGRWLARFFTYRNARCYASRFSERPGVLLRCLSFRRMGLSRLPSGWVWKSYKVFSRAHKAGIETRRERSASAGAFPRRASAGAAATTV